MSKPAVSSISWLNLFSNKAIKPYSEPSEYDFGILILIIIYVLYLQYNTIQYNTYMYTIYHAILMLQGCAYATLEAMQ